MLAFGFSALAVCAAVLFGVAAKDKRTHAIMITASMLASVATALLLGQSEGLVFFAMGTAILSCLIAMCYISRPWIFTALILFLAAIVIAGIYYYGDTTLVGMFGIGSVFGLLYCDVTKPKRDGVKKTVVETNRDVVQILLGIVVFAVLLLVTLPYAIYATFALIMAGYAVNNVFAGRGKGSIYERILATLERSNATYGIGAVYLAVGTMLVIGFVGSKGLMLFGIATLFFADSIATIVGMNLGKKHMPHNNNKTLEGTIAFFLVLSAIGLLLIGTYAVPLAAVLAMIESAEMQLDDNLRSGIALAVLGIALRL